MFLQSVVEPASSEQNRWECLVEWAWTHYLWCLRWSIDIHLSGELYDWSEYARSCRTWYFQVHPFDRHIRCVFASESMRTGCSHSSGEHHFNPRSKICMTITYFWRQNHPTILQAINPLAFCLTQPFGPQIMKHHIIPACPKTEISWVVSWFSNMYIFFEFFQVTLIYDYPSIAAITELVATTGTVPSGSSSEERESLSRCQLHVGYLQADYQTYVFYLVSLWYTSFSTTPLMIVLTKHVFL